MDTTTRRPTLRAAQRTAVALLAALAAMFPASAAPLRFGHNEIEVPAPAGFVAASTLQSSLIGYNRGFMTPSDRLVEMYVAEADVPRVEKGSLGKFDRSFQLHVQRARDGQRIGQAEFAELARGVDAELANLEAQLEELRRSMRRGIERARTMASGDHFDAQLQQIRSLGIFRREPWGVFFTMAVNVNREGGADPATVLVPGGAILVDGQVMRLHGYVSEKDREWGERAVFLWADAVRAANAD